MSEPQNEILSAMGEVALLRAQSGAVLWVNDAFCALFGGAPDDWQGRDFGSARTPGPGERRRYEGETATRKGRRWIEWEETALESGRILSIGRDITERREGEEALRGARDEALAARRMGKAFFSAVTHELRTPLNGVLGMAGLLEASKLTANQAEHVGAIRESGEHLMAMINDILDAARLEAGAVELERSEFDCGRLVRSVVELLAPKAFEKGLEIAAVVDPALPGRVAGDESRLRQILFNLAGAAVRRTEKGGVVVSVRRLPGNQDDLARIEFAVTDDGPGFSEEARISMIDPSMMSDEDAAAADNAGLGLVVARRLVGAMDGDLEIETPPGRGARMTARIDLKVAHANAGRAARLDGRTVIVAAGSAALREALCEQAELMGAVATPAATPAAAMREAMNDPKAALLVDAAWRARLKDAVQSVALAGLLLRPDQRGLISGLKKNGYDFYLLKPVRFATLAARLEGAELDDDWDSPPEAKADSGGREGVRGTRILLAEDNRVNALLASTMLRGEGCIVDIVANGAEAVAAVRRAPYDMVLMDIRMPIKDGLAATRAIRALGGKYVDLPIVALTANAFEEDRQACFTAGMDDFATKPIDMDGVASLLQKWTQTEKQAKLA